MPSKSKDFLNDGAALAPNRPNFVWSFFFLQSLSYVFLCIYVTHDTFMLQGYYKGAYILFPPFPSQLSDFVPLRNGFYSFRAQTD